MEEGEFRGLSEIGHRLHKHLNPVPDRVHAEVLEIVRPDASWRVLDLACGKAELLVRIAERYGARATGIDRSRAHVDDAKRRAASAGVQLDLRVADVREVELEPRSNDLTICIGACTLFDTQSATLARIAELTKDGGTVMFGASYWRAPPRTALIEHLGVDEDWCADYSGTIARGVALGLEPLCARVAEQDALDAYEWLYRSSVARWLRENPGHPHHADAAEANRKGLRMFLDGGREALGFGVFVFRR